MKDILSNLYLGTYSPKYRPNPTLTGIWPSFENPSLTLNSFTIRDNLSPVMIFCHHSQWEAKRKKKKLTHIILITWLMSSSNEYPEHQLLSHWMLKYLYQPSKGEKSSLALFWNRCGHQSQNGCQMGWSWRWCWMWWMGKERVTKGFKSGVICGGQELESKQSVMTNKEWRKTEQKENKSKKNCSQKYRYFLPALGMKS